MQQEKLQAAEGWRTRKGIIIWGRHLTPVHRLQKNSLCSWQNRVYVL